jgi:hypothetical protein
MASLKRNVANQVIFFGLFEAAAGAGGTPHVGGVFTASTWVTIDNGVQSLTAGTFAELGNGQYSYAPTQAETNGISIGFLITVLGNTALGVYLQFFTDTVDGNGLPQVDVQDWAGSAVSAAVSGIPEVDVRYVNGHATTIDANNLLNVNVQDYRGSAALATPTVNVTNWADSAVSAAVSGIPEVDIRYVVGGIATVDSNSLLNVNVQDYLGSAAPATPNVNVVSVAASASNIKKGQALNSFKFVMINTATNQPQAGLTVTATRSIDGSGFAPCSGGVSEISGGWYSINLAGSDMMGNVIALNFTAPGANATNIELITQP